MLRGFLVVCFLVGPAIPAQFAGRKPEIIAPVEDPVSVRIEQRIVKTFDFDERPQGNYEDTPMNWVRLMEAGYPRFLEPSFDYEIGHDAPPSFRLDLRGGSVGMRYQGRDIPVHPESDYRIVAWVRTAGLMHARAYLSGYYVDHAMRKIEDSERWSEPIGGPEADGSWQAVTIDLPGGRERAARLALSLQLRQPEEPRPSADNPRPIPQRDMTGAAWFDDITVLRLPRTTLSLSKSVPFYASGERVECQTTVTDPDGIGLAAGLEVIDAEGKRVFEKEIPLGSEFDPAAVMDLGEQPPGLYAARVSVRVGTQELATHQRTFVRLSESDVAASRPPDSAAAPWGIILNADARLTPELTVELVRAVGGNTVKWPLWHATMDDEALLRGDSGEDRLLRLLQARGIRVMGVLEAPVPSLTELPNGRTRGLLDLLAAPSEEWRAWLALPLSRHGRHIAACQLGEDRQPEIDSGEQLRTAVMRVRAEVEPLLGRPDLAVPLTVQTPLTLQSGTVDILSVSMPPHLPAHRYAEHLATVPPGIRFWITVPYLPEGPYHRRDRLAEFARRLVAAYGAGAEKIFVMQPWTVTTRGGIPDIDLREESLVLRTLGGALGDLKPGPAMWLGGGAEGRLFLDPAQETASLVAFADVSPGSLCTTEVDLGRDLRQMNLWGEITDLPYDANGTRLSLDAAPVVISPIPAWRAMLLGSFGVAPPALEAKVAVQERTLRLVNPRATRLRGELLLGLPGEWDVQPRKIRLDIPPGAAAEYPLRFRVPTNQAVGEYVLSARLDIQDYGAEPLLLRAPVQVDSPGLDVNVLVDSENGTLRVRQRVSNRGERTLNLHTYLIAADVPCDTHIIRNLAPGQTAVREYLLSISQAISDRYLRVTVQELGGELRHNQLFRLEPLRTESREAITIPAAISPSGIPSPGIRK